jgi:hypothetical protein
MRKQVNKLANTSIDKTSEVWEAGLKESYRSIFAAYTRPEVQPSDSATSPIKGPKRKALKRH